MSGSHLRVVNDERQNIQARNTRRRMTTQERTRYAQAIEIAGEAKEYLHALATLAADIEDEDFSVGVFMANEHLTRAGNRAVRLKQGFATPQKGAE